MASTAFLEKAYLAYFGRPVDTTGAANYGPSTNVSEAQVLSDFSRSAESQAFYGTTFGSAQINAIYQMLFNRNADTEGLTHWTAMVATGRVSAAGAAYAILEGAKDTVNGANDKTAISNKLAASTAFTANLDTVNEKIGYAGNAAANVAREFLHNVVATPATVAQVNAAIINAVAVGDTGVAGKIFTLTESVKAGTSGTPDVTAVYWGYNPNGTANDNSTEGPLDGGIPVADLLSFLKTITGLDLAELGLVDDDGVGPFDNVTNLTMSMGNVSTGATADNSGTNADSGSSGTLTINFADGTSKNAEVELGTEYFKFLNNVLFDSEGNSRLFEKVIVPGTESSDASLQPIKLTSSANNGGTLEQGYTTAGNDVIVAGRLELLHQAYIDGGAGYNILEIDAKGTYAQPTAVLNVQEVRVNDLPNFYTVGYGNGDGNLGNTSFTGVENLTPGADVPSTAFPEPTGATNPDSWIDLNRALNIQKLVVTDQSSTSGDLNIVGVRNAATLRLEGGFDGGDTTIQYGQGQTGTLNIELAVGDVTADINLLQSAAVLNINSTGIENHMHHFFAGGSVSRMVVTGTGIFGVDQDLSSSFNGSRPAIIDASTNTGGLDVQLNGHYNVNIKGTLADDEIISSGASGAANGSVTIDAGNANNTIEANTRAVAKITTGAGDDIVSATGGTMVTVTAGDGANSIKTDGSTTVNITTGTGADTISAKNGLSVTIIAGEGNNKINADQESTSAATYKLGTVSITSGTGNDSISAVDSKVVTIDAGAGNNTITVSAAEVNVTTGIGNDKITISGLDATFDNGDLGEGTTGANGFNDGNSNNAGVTANFADALAKGSLLNLNLGAGVNTVVLGRDYGTNAVNQDGVTALEGSVIVGTGIKLYVENNSDLTQADLTGAVITSVQLKQELRITDDQFTAIGANNFSVVRDEEGATEDLYLVVNTDTSLTAILAGKALPASVRLHVELTDGATLSVTAEQLHKQIADAGLIGIDGLNGKLIVTNAGLNFDPFTSAGAADLVIAGGSVTGGTLSGTKDVTVLRSIDGYERPAQAASTDTLVIDTTVTPNVDAVKAIVSEVATLKIIGSADAVFTKAVDLGRDVGATALASGAQGDFAGVPAETDDFTIDFSALTGKVVNLTVANFQDVKQIKGNGTDAAPVRLNVELTAASTVGAAGNANGLKSSGVQTYVVTAIGDDSVGEDAAASAAVVFVCDTTVGVKTLGLRGNYNDTITFKQVNYGTNFLLEGGGTAKADGNPSFSNVGTLNAEYFWQGAEPHATAVVDVVNLDAGTVLRPLNLAGIDIDGADTITLNVAGATNAVIQTIGGNSVENLKFAAAGNVTVRGDLTNVDTKGLKTLSASDVAGVFTLQLSNATTTDLSKAVVTGLDKVVFDASNSALTLTADQALTVGAANVTTTTGVTGSTLNIEDLAGQAIDLTAFGSKNIGTVSIADNAGVVVLDAATVLGNASNNADSLLIKASLNDTTVEMTAAQFNQLSGAGTVYSTNGVDTSTGSSFKANLVLTGLTSSTKLDLTAIDQSTVTTATSNVNVVIRAADVTATAAMVITGNSDTKVALEVVGAVDLSKASVTGFSLAAITKVSLAAGAVLTLTAAQVALINTTDTTPADGIADAWVGLAGSKLNIVDVADGFNVDLNKIAAAGIDIGTLTLQDNTALVANAIVFGANATLGDADAIVTPTKGGLAKGEPVELTTLTLSAKQFNELAGTGSITGDAKVFITGLANNTDANGDNVLTAADTALIDVTGITAPKGTVDLGASAASVTLDAASSLNGFEIVLANGQIIKFSTEAQAGVKISEAGLSATTAVAWLFETVTAPVNTSNYSSTINTLYINENLVDGAVEESLWTTLASTITVEKVNKEGIPDVLVTFDRTNTFEALTAIAGVNYDNLSEFEATANLTINLEGNTNIGNVKLGDTNATVGGQAPVAVFSSLTINSYVDRTTLDNPATVANEDTGFTFQPNKVGNISLNAGTADNLVNVSLKTDNNFADAVNVNGAAATRAGLALEVGTITFAATATVAAPKTNASLTLTGQNAITIAGVDISDAEVDLLDINAVGHTGTLVVTGIAPANGINDFDHIYVMDGHTATIAVTAANTTGTIALNDLLVVAGGANDLTKVANSGAATFDLDAVHFTKDGSLTLTAAQMVIIGTADDVLAVDAGTVADAWSAVAGLNVTLNITEMDSTVPGLPLLLNQVAAAGINIGTITIKAGTEAVPLVVTLDPAMNLGGATSIIVPAYTTLNLTAKQFEQLLGTGTIVGNGVGTAQGKVNITALTGAEASIDLSGVAAQAGTITLSTTAADTTPLTPTANDRLGGTDVALTAAANLAGFSVTLNDLDGAVIGAGDNELSGQTIRFATAVQAERAVIVTGADNNDGSAWSIATDNLERDTNVIWNFNSINTANGKIDTSKYDGALGRVWVNEVLVNGVNIESIFSSPTAISTTLTAPGVVNLNSTTIIRVVDTADLATLLPGNTGVDRAVEVEAFTSLPLGLIFSNPDKLVSVQNLTIDLGGAVSMGNLSIDNIVAAAINNNDNFGTLTINSKLAGSDSTPLTPLANDHLFDAYLLPQGFNPLVNPYPIAGNTMGAISSGLTRGQLGSVTINATGADLTTGKLTFNETAAAVVATPAKATANLVVTGTKNVTIQSVDTTDTDITSLALNTFGFTGTLTAPGASPALQLDNTQTLTITNGNVVDNLATLTVNEGGVITLGTAVNAGVAGNELSFIDAVNFDGTLNLGILAQLDSTNDDLNADGDVLDLGENIAFDMNAGQGITTATLAAANGLTPTLNAGSEWSFDYFGAAAGSYLKITPTVVFQAGSTLRLNAVPLQIEGAVDLTQLVDTVGTAAVEGLFVVGGSIEVLAGATLTLTVSQVLDLQAGGVDIVGAGTLKVTGTSAVDFTLGASIKTVLVDISAVTFTAPDTDVDLTLAGATVGLDVGLAQTVVGSAVVDTITMTNILNNTITGGAGDDAITVSAAGNNTIRVDAGVDTITGLNTGDILVVSAAATANATVTTATVVPAPVGFGFVATAATVNNGIVNLTGGATDNTYINMLAATGANGFSLVGGSDPALGNDILIGSNQADLINGGGDTQTAAAAADTLTGNGGNDVFEFSLSKSTAAVGVGAIQAPAGSDVETIAVNAAGSGSDFLRINYTLNGAAASVDTAIVADLSIDANVLLAISNTLNSLPGVSASATATLVTANGDGANSFEILSIAAPNVPGDPTFTDGDVGDTASVQTVTLSGTVTIGEKYSVTVSLVEGGSIKADFTAVTASLLAVANGLAAEFNILAAAFTVDASVDGAGNLVFTDEVSDNGGFSVQYVGVGTVNGTGASELLAVNYLTADVITDFASGFDKIDLNVVAGTLANVVEAGAADTDYVAALSAANAVIDGLVTTYYFTSITDLDGDALNGNQTTGALFYDANGDTTVDGVVLLTGVTTAGFVFSDIIA